jgi:hypothetical protein
MCYDGSMEPNVECSKCQACSVNNCPLHSEYPNLSVDSLDDEKRCLAYKSSRVKVAERHPGALQFGGLTKTEYSGKMVWERKTPEERQKVAESAKKNLFPPVLSTPAH